MADTIDPARRSRNMARVKGRDTKPEIRVRSALHRMGLRFRVCRADLPGKPDVVFPGRKLAIQVRGCFWHQHEGCPYGRLPKSNLAYWEPKLTGNAKRDRARDEELRAMGWDVLVIWECELATSDDVARAAEQIRGRLRERSAAS